MGFTRFDDLPPVRMPAGYGLRTFRPGDEDAWVTLLNAGDFGVWDRDRLDWMLKGGRGPMPLDGIFFATRGDMPVAAACTYLHAVELGILPEVGWVVVDPAHRGRTLGVQVCRAVLGYIHAQEFEYAFLLTEEFRERAIGMYLRMGFEPEMLDETQPARWDALRAAAGAASR